VDTGHGPILGVDVKRANSTLEALDKAQAGSCSGEAFVLYMQPRGSFLCPGQLQDPL
jgi:hypothetical protein